MKRCPISQEIETGERLTVMVSLADIRECLEEFARVAGSREEKACIQSAMNSIYTAEIEGSRT